jgi:hypothetical protein
MMDNEKRLALREARKVKKQKVTLITPFPISGASFGEDVRGSILRYMFPCQGEITKGLIKLGTRPKNGATVTVKISNSLGSISKDYLIQTKELTISPKLPISDGHCLDISINALEPIQEVWASFLWVPAKQYVEKEIYYEDIEGDSTLREPSVSGDNGTIGEEGN